MVFTEKINPEKVSTSRALCNDTCLTRFRKILNGKKQKNMDSFFFLLKRASVQIQESMSKKQKMAKKMRTLLMILKNKARKIKY